ncbi:phenylalanine--tRNA ligase subunit beta [Candidatus Nomurabacteria bacterium]|nr:phenylalanine--tRNA ligase subunit beta [Candidatus Nomurabacteria bacterium]
MYLSVNWLKSWLKLPSDLSAQDLAHQLTMSTVEVEEVLDQSASLAGVVVGKIKELAEHPDADRLQVCQVDLGSSVEQIVCGGTNLSKGMLVAVATVGSQVKWHGEGELVTLEKVKIRGIESNGMIAASSEIGLNNLFPAKSEKEILDLSSFNLKVGQNLSQALQLNDFVIDIDNKSINHRPDLWGQYGLAREVAAIYRLKLKEYQVSELKIKEEEKLKVTVKDKDKCFRYLGLVIKNVKIAPSPWWLKVRLEAVGLRPINNIVDVTNYVMYELGQPMHAFDAKMIEGQEIQVLSAKKGEKFVTLDGVKRRLNENSLMISDGKKYVALAGIMGGQNSEISLETENIILESANFQASNIRRTSTALGLRSESSSRFEKSLDPEIAELAIKKAAELILALNEEAYVASRLVDVNNSPFSEITLSVPEDLINKRFGVVIPTKEIKDILGRLQFKVTYKNKIFEIKVPSFRATKDISIPEDIVEEVARIYGYDNIQASLPEAKIQTPQIDLAHTTTKDLRYWLSLAQEYTEVYNYPFTNVSWAEKLGLNLTEHIKVKNTISADQAYLNLSLLPNLLAKAEENFRFFDEIRIFELERVFDKNKKGVYHVDPAKKKYLPAQDKQISGVKVTVKDEQVAFLEVKGLLESLGEYLGLNFILEKTTNNFSKLVYNIKEQDVILGQFGLLKESLFDSGPTKVQVAWWQLNFSSLVKYINQNTSYQSLAKFPSVNRDLAILVGKNVLWEDLVKEIVKVSPLLINVEPFDVFMGKGVPENKKSIAFHLEFRSPEKTLESEDVEQLIKKILDILNKKFQAQIR